MLVSHYHKFIYTKTVKTAGSSVESFFERFCMPQNEWEFSHARDEYESDFGIIGYRGSNKPLGTKYWNHMSAKEIKGKIGNKVWATYYKFCVIRNPYDKVLSAFYFFNKENQNINFDLSREKQAFEDWLLGQPQLGIDRDKYLIDNKFSLDSVIRYENLINDIQCVCHKLGVDFHPDNLPELKMGLRPNESSVEKMYTSTSKKIVENYYKFEFDYFNYKFPG